MKPAATLRINDRAPNGRKLSREKWTTTIAMGATVLYTGTDSAKIAAACKKAGLTK